MHRQKQLAGFTLVELVVVIAIIAVVAGLTFPAFVKAKRSAKVETAKQYLKQQFIAIDLYASDNTGVYPGYEDVYLDPKLQAPCSPLYDWNRPCWDRSMVYSSAPRPPLIGGRGYIYALRDLDSIDPSPKGTFLGWDKTKPYPLLADVFSADYRLSEFDAEVHTTTDCTREELTSHEFGCRFPDRIWYAYTDGSLRVWKRKMDFTEGRAHAVFDWYHTFFKQMDRDTVAGN